ETSARQRGLERPRGDEGEEPHDEERGEHEHVQHAVDGEPVVVALDDGRKERIEVEPGVLQRLEESGEDSTEQCGQRDDQIRRRQAGFGGQIHGARHPRRRAWMLEDDGRHERGSTMTRAHMVWCAMPQYSWHSSGYSPGVSKRAVDRAIWPGSSIRLMLAPLMNI